MVSVCGGCNNCGPKPDCNTCNDECARLEYVPGTACTIALSQGGCTTTFNLHDGVKACETDTSLRWDPNTGCMTYESERHDDTLCLCDMLESVSIDCLGDVEISDKPINRANEFLARNTCDEDDCSCDKDKWHNFSIPRDNDCVVPVEDGYYKVLTLDDCGSPQECKLPVVAPAVNAYIRDSVPDDPDFPWYYGQYNEDIKLYLKDNAPEFFGKYDLEVTINYGVQALRPDKGLNMNFRSMMIPVVEGEQPDAEHEASILQDDVSLIVGEDQAYSISWGTKSMRASITKIVPKGKELNLHHEFRLRSRASFPNYQSHALDGQVVPESVASQVDKMEWNASRLHALQIIVRPALGTTKKQPVVDKARNQLDPAVDVYPNPAQGA